MKASSHSGSSDSGSCRSARLRARGRERRTCRLGGVLRTVLRACRADRLQCRPARRHAPRSATTAAAAAGQRRRAPVARRPRGVATTASRSRERPAARPPSRRTAAPRPRSRARTTSSRSASAARRSAPPSPASAARSARGRTAARGRARRSPVARAAAHIHAIAAEQREPEPDQPEVGQRLDRVAVRVAHGEPVGPVARARDARRRPRRRRPASTTCRPASASCQYRERTDDVAVSRSGVLAGVAAAGFGQLCARRPRPGP